MNSFWIDGNECIWMWMNDGNEPVWKLINPFFLSFKTSYLLLQKYEWIHLDVNECNLCTKWIYSHLLLYVLIQMGFKWDKMSHNSSDWTLQTSQAFRQKMIVWIVSTKPKFEFIFQLAFWVWTCSVWLKLCYNELTLYSI